MNYEILVSIIMPVYNAEKYLSEAIESILTQTYKKFEFIIIDDGSTDNSLEIIKSYALKDKRIKFFTRENKGLVNTLNELISLSNGKYIVRMDADDISLPKRVEMQVTFMEKYKDIYLAGTKYDLLIEQNTDIQLIDSMRRIQKKVNSFTNNISQNVLIGYVLLHPTWIFRKELISLIGNYKNYNHCEDGEFLFRILSNGYKIGIIEEKLFKYRIYNNSKSCNDRLSNQGIKEDTIKYHMEYLEKQKTDCFIREYVIWGTDITGKLTHKYMQENYPNTIFKGYIDSFATIQDEKKGIYNPSYIITNENCYVLIATNGGLSYAVDYLNKLGKVIIKNYFSVV